MDYLLLSLLQEMQKMKKKEFEGQLIEVPRSAAEQIDGYRTQLDDLITKIDTIASIENGTLPANNPAANMAIIECINMASFKV